MLLALDTATDICALALWEGGPGGRVVATLTLRRGQEHAARLVPAIDALLAAAGAHTSDLAAVAVSAGPGSYTGLRIGASTAKALCLATGAALVPVATLDALALAAGPTMRPREVLVVVLPSRRGEVYAAAFAVMSDADKTLLPLLPPTALAVSDAPAWLARKGESMLLAVPGLSSTPVRLAGPGAARLSDVLPAATVVPGIVADAACVARLAALDLAAGTTADVATWEPSYLKEWQPGG